MIINRALLIQLLSHQYAKLTGYIIIGLCSLWITLNLIKTSSIIFYHAPAQPSSSYSPTNNIQTQLLIQIPSWHLFGQTPITPINEQNVPLSSLNLTVNGIFYQKNKKSQAIISDANSNSKLYKIGDIVPGGIKLYDILPNSVIVESNGQLEKITLPGEDLQFSPPPQELP